jgi:DNA-binding transcriptional ArsR family regulator
MARKKKAVPRAPVTHRRTAAAAAKRGRPRRESGPEAAASSGAMRVSRLDQVKVLAHPLRLRMLELFGEKPRTTKQVAEDLGEKPTRLYHHVDAMARVGLISLTETRQNRGATEKYYAAVAKRFEVGNDVFGKGSGAAETETLRVIRTLVESAGADAVGFFEGDPAEPEVAPVIAHAMLRGTREEVEKVRAALMRVLEMKSEGGGAASTKIGRPLRYTLTILFHPARED